MQQKSKNLLLSIDLFNPHFEFEINQLDTRFSTRLGGIYSIFIGFFIIIFISYRIMLWSSGTFINSFITYEEKAQHIYKSSFHDLKFNIQPKFLSPQYKWNSDKNIFSTQFIVYEESFVESKIIKTLSLTNNCSYINNVSDSLCLDQNDQVDIILDPSKQFPDNSWLINIVFYVCSNETLTEGQCASQEEIDDFFKNVIQFRVSMSFQQYSINEGKLIERQLVYLLQVSQKTVSVNLIFLKQIMTKSESGYPFDILSQEYQFMQDDRFFLFDLSKYICQYYTLEGNILKSSQNQAFLEINVQIDPTVRFQIVTHQSLLDQIVITFGIIKIFMSFGTLTIKVRARRILNNKIKSLLTNPREQQQITQPISQEINRPSKQNFIRRMMDAIFKYKKNNFTQGDPMINIIELIQDLKITKLQVQDLFKEISSIKEQIQDVQDKLTEDTYKAGIKKTKKYKQYNSIQAYSQQFDDFEYEY